MNKRMYVGAMISIVDIVYTLLRMFTETSIIDSLILGMLCALLVLPLVEKLAKDEEE